MLLLCAMAVERVSIWSVVKLTQTLWRNARRIFNEAGEVSSFEPKIYWVASQPKRRWNRSAGVSLQFLP